MKKKKEMSAKKFGAIFIPIFIPITAVLLVLSLVATGVMQYWSTVMDAVFGGAQISITMTNTFRASWDVPELNAQEIDEACDSANAADNKVQIVWVGRAGGEYHDAPGTASATPTTARALVTPPLSTPSSGS